VNIIQKKFYLVIIGSTIIGSLVSILGLNPIKLLFYTAVVYGIVSPPLIFIILHIGNNRKIMGTWVNGALSNFLGVVTFLLMSAGALFFFFTL